MHFRRTSSIWTVFFADLSTEDEQPDLRRTKGDVPLRKLRPNKLQRLDPKAQRKSQQPAIPLLPLMPSGKRYSLMLVRLSSPRTKDLAEKSATPSALGWKGAYREHGRFIRHERDLSRIVSASRAKRREKGRPHLVVPRWVADHAHLDQLALQPPPVRLQHIHKPRNQCTVPV
jgi:hypothetical protein